MLPTAYAARPEVAHAAAGIIGHHAVAGAVPSLRSGSCPRPGSLGSAWAAAVFRRPGGVLAQGGCGLILSRTSTMIVPQAFSRMRVRAGPKPGFYCTDTPVSGCVQADRVSAVPATLARGCGVTRC